MKNLTVGIILLLSIYNVNAQYEKGDTTYKKCFVGTSLFMLANLVPDDNPPNFAQINMGYRLSPKDVISLELKTWTYRWSLGIPYGKSTEAPEEKFPGYIKEYGFAVAYQRFLRKGLYAGVHVMSSWQTFVNNDGNKIDKGFQIFNTYRLGYHIKLFKDRFFIEPSIAITHRPFQSKMPASFAVLNDKWPSYFIGEPGLHVGFNF